MDVAFAQDHILLTLEFDFKAIFRVKQHLVAHFDRPHVGTYGDCLRSGQSLGHLGRGRDQDA